MIVQAVTTWRGTPEKIKAMVDDVSASAEAHKSMGAKNPRFWRSMVGGNLEHAYYSIEFDSHEEYGKFTDKMLGSDFWTGMQAFVNDGYPDIKYISTDLYYSLI